MTEGKPRPVSDPMLDGVRSDILQRLLSHEQLVHGLPVVPSGVIRAYLERFKAPLCQRDEDGNCIAHSASDPNCLSNKEPDYLCEKWCGRCKDTFVIHELGDVCPRHEFDDIPEGPKR